MRQKFHKYSVAMTSLLLFTMIIGCASPTTKRAPVNEALVKKEAQKQREIAVQSQFKAQSRLLRIGYPILKSSVSLCKDDIKPTLGVFYINKQVFDKEFQQAAVTQFGVGDRLKAIYVIPGSSADKAGIKKGDILTQFNAQPIPSGEDAVKTFTETLNNELKDQTLAKLTVQRGEQQQSIEAIPDIICKYPLLLKTSNEVNAYADGKNIIITRGMMRFTENDQELSLVIAHELAHNTMSHMDSKVQNYVLGSILDIVAAAYGVNTQGVFGNAAAQAYSKEFEAEADYVGLYIMARSGQEIKGAANFWRRMAAEHPGNIQKNHAASHPATPERFVAIEKTVEEIHNKIDSGLALTPEIMDEHKNTDDESNIKQEDW